MALSILSGKCDPPLPRPHDVILGSSSMVGTYISGTLDTYLLGNVSPVFHPVMGTQRHFRSLLSR